MPARWASPIITPPTWRDDPGTDGRMQFAIPMIDQADDGQSPHQALLGRRGDNQTWGMANRHKAGWLVRYARAVLALTKRQPGRIIAS